MVLPKQVLEALSAGKAAPAYYLFGNEPYKIEEFLEKATLAHAAVRNASEVAPGFVERLDGSSCTGAQVLESLQTFGLFSSTERKLVVVRNAGAIRDSEVVLEAMDQAQKSNPWEGSLLFLVADSIDGRRKLSQWMKKKDLILEFRQARDAELRQWASYMARKQGLTLATDAVELLSVSSQGSLYRMEQEITKAALYAGATEVRAEHVASVASLTGAHEMSDTVSAILTGKRARALLLTEKLVKSSEDAIGLAGFLTWALKNPEKGVGKRCSPAQTRRLLKALLQLDLELKSSPLDASALVERFVIESC